VSLSEPGDPVGRGGEQHPVALVRGRDPQPGGEVGLPVPGGPSSTTLRASVKKPPDARAADAPEEERARLREETMQALGAAIAKSPQEWFEEEEAAKRLLPGGNRLIRTISTSPPGSGKRRK